MLEGSAGFRAKKLYLSFLAKHSLSHSTYFYYRQIIQFTRSVLYSLMSIMVFIFIEKQCEPAYRLYPSWVQLVEIFMAYIICLQSLFSMTYILIYLINAYWFFLKLLLMILFFFIYVVGNFFNSDSFSFDQQLCSCLSPLPLFYSITQQLFKT